jgi:fructosamine-3-kinase
MEFSEQFAPQIVFTNEPKLSDQEADKNFNERRLGLLPHVKEFISTHVLFRNKATRVTFATRGISSLVSTIETPTEKVVLKIPLSRDYSHGESQFLNTWEQVGVSVPHVMESGVIDEHPYVLMEYVDAPTLSEKYTHEELVEKGIYSEMGQTLRKMHSAVAEGYGRVVDGKAKFATFTEWIDSKDMQHRVEYVREHGLLDEQHGAFAEIRDMLIHHDHTNPVSSYCHDDFGSANIFATEPITIFDPNPRFNNGYIDLGRSLMIHIANGGTDESKMQLLDGYFGGNQHDQEALHASIALATYMKFPYWHKVRSKRVAMIENITSYLVKNRHLLKG